LKFPRHAGKQLGYNAIGRTPLATFVSIRNIRSFSMPLPDQTPRLPKWPFLVGDCALIGAAWLIADRAAHPLPAEAMLAIGGCAACAAIVGAIPFVADYARKQDQALDERQRSLESLESLARTLSGAAEQISIAAGGFNEIAELSQKNLRHAEQLPQKLHEKIAEFQARLAQATDEEKDEMERELAILRGSESEKLESTATKVARAAADWAKVETASQKHLATTKAILAQFEEAVAQIDTRISSYSETLSRLAAQRDRPEPSPAAVPQPTVVVPEKKHEDPAQPAVVEEKPIAPVSVATPDPIESAPEASSSSHAAEASHTVESSAADESSATPAPDPAVAKPERKRPLRRTTDEKNPENSGAPKPIPAEKIREKKPEPESPEPLALEFFQESPDDQAPTSAMSADGATRLLVTAYIGIGNRLFIRGDGPGLNWEKGVPLQFVSIGKWRWETEEAAAPITFKLLKNDETETAGPSAPPLEPGRQIEITATF
jgi:biopolymer transport protein ExbB/TolQ